MTRTSLDEPALYPRDEEGNELEALDETLLTEDERAYRDARRLADEKLVLSRQAVRAALITVPLLIFLPFAGVISLIYFGVKLGRRAFRAFYEPQLHARFLKEEVERRVKTHVSSERRHLEGEHHRSLEQLSASIAHEIRNPITAAKSLVQQIGEDPGSSDREEYARVAVAELERVERSISHLLRFAREEETRLEEIELTDVVESALVTFRDRAERRGIEIVRGYASPDVDQRISALEGDAEQLRRVVINLVGNAIDAFEAPDLASGDADRTLEGREIRVSIGENLAGDEVWLRVADNGRGIDPAARERIFDPFFTSREEGTGLGLALCRKIVDNHAGSIDVVSEPGEGTAFVLTFPRRQPPRDEPRSPGGTRA